MAKLCELGLGSGGIDDENSVNLRTNSLLQKLLLIFRLAKEDKVLHCTSWYFMAVSCYYASGLKPVTVV
jgi:hypothetical protein